MVVAAAVAVMQLGALTEVASWHHLTEVVVVVAKLLPLTLLRRR